MQLQRLAHHILKYQNEMYISKRYSFDPKTNVIVRLIYFLTPSDVKIPWKTLATNNYMNRDFENFEIISNQPHKKIESKTLS